CGHSAAAEARYASTTAASRIDASSVQGCLQGMDGTGEILQQIDVDIEAQDEGKILVAQDLAQKFTANFLFHVEHTGLATAGIDQNAQSQRKIRLRGKILDGLRLAILQNLKIFLLETGDQSSFLIPHIEEELHHIHVDFQGGRSLVLILVLPALVLS